MIDNILKKYVKLFESKELYFVWEYNFLHKNKIEQIINNFNVGCCFKQMLPISTRIRHFKIIQSVIHE